jgi:hypothetical protein
VAGIFARSSTDLLGAVALSRDCPPGRRRLLLGNVGFAREKLARLFVSSLGRSGRLNLPVTVLLFPRVPESGGQIDLDAHYYKNRRIFFLANAAGWTLGLPCNLTFPPIRSWLNQGVIIPVLIVFLSILAAITGSRRYHAAFAIFALATITLALLADGTPIQ